MECLSSYLNLCNGKLPNGGILHFLLIITYIYDKQKFPCGKCLLIFIMIIVLYVVLYLFVVLF